MIVFVMLSKNLEFKIFALNLNLPQIPPPPSVSLTKESLLFYVILKYFVHFLSS